MSQTENEEIKRNVLTEVRTADYSFNRITLQRVAGWLVVKNYHESLVGY